MPFLFKNRADAGKQLAKALMSYQGEDVVVLGLPRGGVVLASEVASSLKAPLDLVFAHKIGHPLQEEYAIAAISESGYLLGNDFELKQVESKWLENQKEKELERMRKRRELYLKGVAKQDLKNKTVILVDDGIATGLTLQVAIEEVKHHKPKKIIVGVPIAAEGIASKIKRQVDQLVALQIDPDFTFLGAVGCYYEEFSQVEDEAVIDCLRKKGP
jgi:predicted phosphoribosyltransferase